MTEEQIEILKSTSHPQATTERISPSVAVELLRELQAIYCQTKYCNPISFAITAVIKLYKEELKQEQYKTVIKKQNRYKYNIIIPCKSDKWNGYFCGVNVYRKTKHK